MASLEPDVLDTLDIDKVLKYVVRWLRNEKTTQYFEEHPAACDTIVIAVEEVIRSKRLLTPASTPYTSNLPDEQTSTTLPSQYTTQEAPGRNDKSPTPSASRNIARKGGFGDDNSADQLENVSGAHHDRSSPASQQELEQGSQLFEDVDDCESEENDGSQYSASLDSLPLVDHELHDQNARPNGRSSRKTTTSSKRYESDTSPLSRKRKHELQHEADSKRSYNKTRLGSNQDEWHDKQQKTLEGCKDDRLSIAAAGDTDRFTMLSLSLRAKLRRIADAKTLATLWDYLQYKRSLLSSADVSSDCTGTTEVTGFDIISVSDKRLMELKFRIVKDEKEEKSLKQRRIIIRISKRVALVELIGKYIEKRDIRRAVPRKRGKKQFPQSSLKDRFTDLLFPETIKYKDEQLSKGDENPRDDAKRKLDNWLQQGEPLVRIAQRFGIAVLALFPQGLTDKIFHSLPRPQIPVLVDYIDSILPGLEGQVRNLSTILPQIVENRLPPQRLVLETLTRDVLPQPGSRPLEELFHFDTNVVNFDQVDGPSLDQGSANETLCYALDAGKSQSTSQDSTSGPQCQIPCAETEVGEPSNTTTECGEHRHPSTYHERSQFYHELNEEFNKYMKDLSYSQDVDQFIQAQQGYIEGVPNAEDYYIGDVDYCAEKPPSDGDRQPVNSQEDDSQQSGSSEPELLDFDSFISYSP